MGLFLSIALLVWSLMHVYVFWRASSVPLITRHLPVWALAVLAAFLWASFVLARFLSRFGALAGALDFIGSYWIGILFLALVCLLAADLVTGFGFLLPRLAPSLRGWALAACAVLSAIAIVQAARAPVVRDYEVRIAGLPAERDGTVLVVGFDFHVGSMLGERWLRDRVAQIASLKPDAIILAGDIAEGDDDSERELIGDFRRLTAPLGLWAVGGNHEHYGRLAGNQRDILEEAGFQVLHDRWAELAPGLVISGVDDLTSRRRRGETVNSVERALAGRPPGAATVFVSHTPWEAEKAAASGAGLMLSGHTHNGQIWPFTYVVRMVYPRVGGRYEVNGMTLVVCRGTGTWGPRMRLWLPSELLRITLRSAAKT